MKIQRENETKIQLFSRNVFMRKTSFSIKVNVRKPYVLSSRMRVAEDSPKKRKSEKWEKTFEKNIQKYVSKKECTKYGKTIKKLSKKDVNVKKKP